jgi:hypothetical protein
MSHHIHGTYSWARVAVSEAVLMGPRLPYQEPVLPMAGFTALNPEVRSLLLPASILQGPYLDEPGQSKVPHFAYIVLPHKDVPGGQVPVDIIL